MTTPAPVAEAAAQPEGLELRAEALLAGRVAALLVAVSPLVGLLWAAVTPRVAVVAHGGTVDFVSDETRAFFGGDVVFGLIGLLAGVLCGLLAWRLTRPERVGAPIGLGVGALVGAGLAALVGKHLYEPGFRRALAHPVDGRVFHLYPAVHAKAVLLAWAVASVLTYAVCLLSSPSPSSAAAPAEDA